jgi:hypothetical protein
MNKWNIKYSEAKNFHLKNGHLRVPIMINGKRYNLGTWISNQRKAYKKNELSQSKINMLNEINMIWNVFESNWKNNYFLAKRYYKDNGHLLIPITHEDQGINLGKWISHQRDSYKGIGNSKLSENQIKLLNAIGMKWEPIEDQWNVNFQKAKQYYQETNNLLVPYLYETKDKFKLGVWISGQRQNHKFNILSKEKIEILESIGMVWNVEENNWKRYFVAAKRYYVANKHLYVPVDFVTEDGINLGGWLSHLRTTYKGKGRGKLTKYHIELLNKIGMVWDNSSFQTATSFNEQVCYYYIKSIFPEAINRYNELGIELDIYIPSLKIAIEYDGNWHKDRLNKDKEKNQICRENGLELIRIREPKCPDINSGFICYTLKNLNVDTYEQILKDLFSHIKYKYNESILPDINISRDGHIIKTQYANTVLRNWNEWFLLAKEFYYENGNLLVAAKYKINDKGLGSWISNQRYNYKKNRLSYIQIKMLESYGMVWNVNEYKRNNK